MRRSPPVGPSVPGRLRRAGIVPIGLGLDGSGQGRVDHSGRHHVHRAQRATAPTVRTARDGPLGGGVDGLASSHRLRPCRGQQHHASASGEAATCRPRRVKGSAELRGEHPLRSSWSVVGRALRTLGAGVEQPHRAVQAASARRGPFPPTPLANVHGDSACFPAQAPATSGPGSGRRRARRPGRRGAPPARPQPLDAPTPAPTTAGLTVQGEETLHRPNPPGPAGQDQDPRPSPGPPPRTTRPAGEPAGGCRPSATHADPGGRANSSDRRSGARHEAASRPRTAFTLRRRVVTRGEPSGARVGSRPDVARLVAQARQAGGDPVEGLATPPAPRPRSPR